MTKFADDAHDLIKGYHRFRANKFRETSAIFEKLNKGQKPATMIVACADSRADPSMIFDAAPGELFVVRNVAALVPPCESGTGLHGVSAALEFAVTKLKVRQILVMGHGGCGGVDACLRAVDEGPVGTYIGQWVELAASARDEILANPDIEPDAQHEALEHAAVLKSIENLATFPFVKEALDANELDIHGAWFSIGRGELHWRDPQTGEFKTVESD